MRQCGERVSSRPGEIMAAPDNRKRHILFLFKGVISVALLWYLVNKVDTALLAGRLSSVRVAPIAAAAGLLFVQIAIVTLRWRIVVGVISRTFRFGELFRIVLMGMFFNQALPTALGGDVVRAWYIHLAGVRGRRAVYSVLLDRLSALAASALVMLALIGFVFELVTDVSVRGGFIAVIGAIFAGFLVLLTLDRIGIRFFPALIARPGIELTATARRLLLDPRPSAGVLGLSALSLCCTVFVIYLIGSGVSVPVTLRDCFVLVPPVILMSMLPVSVAGWGVRELAMVTAFGYAGVADADALLLSIAFGVMNLAVALPGGIVWLLAVRSAPPPDVSELESD